MNENKSNAMSINRAKNQCPLSQIDIALKLKIIERLLKNSFDDNYIFNLQLDNVRKHGERKSKL